MCIRNKFSCRIIFIIALTFFARSSYGQTDDDVLDFLPPILAVLQSNAVDGSANATNLCADFLVNDKVDRPMTALSKPAPLATYTDPVFGSKVTRVSNANAIDSGIIKTMYSTVQAWNADESRMILWHRGEGHYLYHGDTYALIEKLNVMPSDIEQIFWSMADPDVFIYPSQAVGNSVPTSSGSYSLKGNELIEYNISSKLYRVIKDFNSLCTGDDGITSGNDVQMPAYDGDLFGLRCGDVLFTYRPSTDATTVLPDTNLSSDQVTAAPMPFPSGQLSYHYDTVRDQSLVTQRVFYQGSPSEHSSLGRMHNGNDAYFATGFDATTNGHCDRGIGSLVVNDASNGDCRVLVGPSNGYPYTLSGTHVSALANLNPGWAVVSSVGYGVEGDTLLEQELYLANTDPDNLKVCRIAHHRSSARHGSIGYFAEPHPVISPSGTRILFSSDWNDSGQVDVYVIELPSYKG